MSKQTDPIDAFYNRPAYPGDPTWQGGQPMVDPLAALREENARLLIACELNRKRAERLEAKLARVIEAGDRLAGDVVTDWSHDDAIAEWRAAKEE